MHFSRIWILSLTLAFSFLTYSMEQKHSPALVEMVEELEKDISKIRWYSPRQLSLLLTSEEAQQIQFKGRFDIEWTLPSWVLYKACNKISLKDHELSSCERILGNGSETPERLLLCKAILQDTHSMNDYESGNLIKKFPRLFLKALKGCFLTAHEKRVQVLLEAYPQAVKKLIPMVKERLSTLSPATLEIALKHSPSHITELAATLEKLCTQDPENKDALDLAPFFVKKDPSLLAQFLPLLTEHRYTLKELTYRLTSLLDVSNPEGKKSIIALLGDHIDKPDFETSAFYFFIKKLKRNFIPFLIPYVVQKIKTIDPLKIAYLLDRYPQMAKDITIQLQPLAEGQDSPSKTLSSILTEDPHYSLHLTTNYMLSPAAFELYKISSQTEGYLASKRALARLRYGKDASFDDLTKDIRILDILDKAHENEKHLIAEGYYVLVTGQPERYHLFIDFYTTLWQLKKGKSLDTQLLVPTSEGREMFFNAGIFNNFQQSVECSLFYFTHNTCEYGGCLGLSTIFKAFNLEEYYQKYEQEFESLQELHTKALCGYGNFLQIGLSKELLRKYTFAALPGGYEAKVTIDDDTTDDPAIILSTLMNNPHHMQGMEGILFCLKQHELAKIQPHPGLKIYSFNVKDNEAWKEYTKMRDILLKKIVNE